MCFNDWSTGIDQTNVGAVAPLAVAHELGHNFGMNHDSEGNTCSVGDIMSPMVCLVKKKKKLCTLLTSCLLSKNHEFDTSLLPLGS